MRVFLFALLFAVTTSAQDAGFFVDELSRAWFYYHHGIYSVSTAVPHSEIIPGYETKLTGVASDGKTISWTEARTYKGFPGGPIVTDHTGFVLRRGLGAETPISNRGSVGISRNGEWAVWSYADREVPDSRWVNLVTGREVSLPGVAVTIDSVADDGTVVSIEKNRLVVYSPNGSPEAIDTLTAARVLLSADARHMLIEGPSTLTLYERESKKLTRLPPGPSALSADGTTVAYAWGLAKNQIFLVDVDTMATRALPAIVDPAASLQFGVDGAALWVWTAGFGFLRIDLPGGETSTVMPPTPRITTLWKSPVRGARYRIDGVGFTDATNISLITQIGREPVSIAGRGPGWLQVQLPAGLTIGLATWSASSDDAPLTDYSPQLQSEVLENDPQFLQLRDLGEPDPIWANRPVAFGAFDGGLLNPDRLAIPGEELLFWMTGINHPSDPIPWILYTSDGLTQNLSILSLAPDPNNVGWWILRLRLPIGTPAGYAAVGRGAPIWAPFYVSSAGSPSIESSK